MQYLDNYTLQCSANSNIKKHNLLANISYVCKIIAILSLIGLFWSLYFLIAFAALWTLSIILSSHKNKLVFDYKYRVFEGKLLVYKEYIGFKKEMLADIKLKDIISCTIYDAEDTQSEKNYYDKNFSNGFVIKVTTNDDNFVIISDEYMFSVLNYHINKDKI